MMCIGGLRCGCGCRQIMGRLSGLFVYNIIYLYSIFYIYYRYIRVYICVCVCRFRFCACLVCVRLRPSDRHRIVVFVAVDDGVLVVVFLYIIYTIPI